MKPSESAATSALTTAVRRGCGLDNRAAALLAGLANAFLRSTAAKREIAALGARRGRPVGPTGAFTAAAKAAAAAWLRSVVRVSA